MHTDSFHKWVSNVLVFTTHKFRMRAGTLETQTIGRNLALGLFAVPGRGCLSPKAVSYHIGAVFFDAQWYVPTCLLSLISNSWDLVLGLFDSFFSHKACKTAEPSFHMHPPTPYSPFQQLDRRRRVRMLDDRTCSQIVRSYAGGLSLKALGQGH